MTTSLVIPVSRSYSPAWRRSVASEVRAANSNWAAEPTTPASARITPICLAAAPGGISIDTGRPGWIPGGAVTSDTPPNPPTQSAKERAPKYAPPRTTTNSTNPASLREPSP